MNSRERFLDTLAYGQPDRVPLFEEGLRDPVLQLWREQGLPGAISLKSIFPFDRREEVELDVDPHPQPAFWPEDQSLLAMMEQRLDAANPGRLPALWPQKVKRWRHRDHVLMFRVNHGFFQTLGVQGWSRFEEVIILSKDEPQLVKDFLLLQGTFTAKLLERLLAEVQIDAAIFSEPIAGNHGSLISPRMYEDLVLVGYQPILQVLQRFGVKYFVMRTYANPRVLLPAMVNAGFNCLWACEAPPGTMDYGEIRREYGRELRLIGGIDVDLLLGEFATLRKALVEDVAPLITDGGFIPMADGRVRGNVPYANYVAYRECLTEIVTDRPVVLA